METSLSPKSESSTTIPCVNPASGETLGEVRIDDPAAVAETVARARDAQIVWAKTSFRKRRAVLKRIQQHVLDHADELCELVVRDAGKTRENAMMGEIWTVSEKLRWTIRHGEKHLRPERVSAASSRTRKRASSFTRVASSASSRRGTTRFRMCLAPSSLRSSRATAAS